MRQANDLLEAIRAFGLSQTEISKRTQIAQPKLSRWFAGAVPSSADDALRLSKLLTDLQAEAAKASRRAKKAAA